MSKNGAKDQQQGKDFSGDGSGETTVKNGETSSSLIRGATGPRTQQGKERSKHNALKYGIFSKVVVLKTESKAEFEDMLNGLSNYHQPEGTLEEILVEKLAALFWRERRLILADSRADIGNQDQPGLIVKGFEFETPAPAWDLFLRYETTLDRAIDRTLAQLERYQRMRLGHPVPPPINVNVSSS